ncbi:UNVERIFIED_CONTAM: hypothetical protein GTU68_017251 [Idotea baltica]|nr:hypothetical protein [Idotea baltica]
MTKLIESRESSNYHRCGRTDKGVSAFSQVISITVRSRLPNKETGDVDTQVLDENHQEEINYAQTLNRVLPLDIRVLAWSPAQEGFSARFDCTARTYKYFFPRANLNLDAMNEAAQHLVGEKDYRNLCKMDIGNGVVHFKRRILAVSLKQMERDHEDSSPSGYEMCVATIDGVAFLWHQIRAIMTVLLLVGEGKEEPDIVLKLLDVEAVKRSGRN